MKSILRYGFNISLIAFVFSALLSSCSLGENEGREESVWVYLPSKPESLNAVLSSDANSSTIQNYLYQTLQVIDDNDFSMNPVLIIENPKTTILTEGPYAGGMVMEMQIREEATWDNGTPITAHDVDYTYRMIKNLFLRHYIRDHILRTSIRFGLTTTQSILNFIATSNTSLRKVR